MKLPLVNLILMNSVLLGMNYAGMGVTNCHIIEKPTKSCRKFFLMSILNLLAKPEYTN